jgi:hypothetical protein
MELARDSVLTTRPTRYWPPEKRRNLDRGAGLATPWPAFRPIGDW